MSWWLSKDRITIHLKPDQIEALPQRINEGEGHKTGIKLYIYHPINLHGVENRFVNLIYHKWKVIMANTYLTNQRQLFVEESVRSGDHMEAAKKTGYKDTHTLRNQGLTMSRDLY